MVATHGLFRMEQVRNPVLNSLEADAKLVDSIPQNDLGPQLVPYRAAAPIGESTCPVLLRVIRQTTPENGMLRLPPGRGRPFVRGDRSQFIRNFAKL